MEHHAYHGILARLREVRNRQNVVKAMRGALLLAAILIVAVLAVLLLETGLHSGRVPRTILFWTPIAAIAVGFILVVARPLARRLGLMRDEDDLTTAERVGAGFPDVRDRLMNALQMLRDRDRAASYYSLDLLDAAFLDVQSATQHLDFRSIVDTAPLRRTARLLAIVTVVTTVIAALLVGPLGEAGHRLIHFREDFIPAAPFRFVVEPGNKEIVKGQDVTISIRVEGPPPPEIILRTRPDQQVSYEEEILKPSASGGYTHTLRAVHASTTYEVASGEVTSDEYTLRVIDRPAVKMLRVQLTFPRYTGMPPQQLDDNVGDVTALKGTDVRVSLEASKDVARARLVFSDTTTVALQINSRSASGHFRLMKDRSYHLQLVDGDSIVNVDPIQYSLRALSDAYPEVSVIMPGTNLDVSGDEQLSLLVRISDDFGFSSLRLAHRLTHSRYEQPADAPTYIPIPLPSGLAKEGLVPFVLNLTSLHLAPEDQVSYYVEIFDNDEVSGPKSAVSETYTLRLPSMEEVFAGLDKKHDASIEQLQEAMKQAEEAKKELEDLTRDVKKQENKVKWEDQKRAEELAKRYQEMQKKLGEVNQTVDKMLEEMQKHDVLSKETLEKYQELQQLMEQLNTPEFAEAMKKLQQSMQQMSPEAMKQALQQFSFSEENFRKGIERTLNLLKRIQIEQKVDELVKRTAEMERQQEELAKQTEEQPRSDNDAQKLAQEQRDIQEQLKKLEQELADLQKKMEDFPSDMPLKEMQELRKELDKNDLRDALDKAQQMLQQQHMQGAMQQQRNAQQMMQGMMQRMQSMKQAMQSTQQRQIANEMRRALQDLLDLSERQEALKNESRSLDPNSQQFRQNAQEQMALLQDLGNITSRLSNLSQKTFSITPEMGKSIGDAMRKMGEAMQSLDQRNGQSAGQQQGEAMGALNETAQQMQGALNSMMQGGGQGMGMGGFMQRLQQLSGMQKGINEGTQNMSPERAAELGRLAGEQGMVRKSLEQLAKEAANAGQMSKLLGDLNRVAQDMREVQTDLAQGNVNPETLRKQDRILSRLLDSQRSMRERDFEKKRKAETGTTASRNAPPSLDLSSQEGRSRLRKDLLKALEQGYSRDYEELIRRYFEALEAAPQPK